MQGAKNNFPEKAYQLIKKVPRGRVTTYKEIANKLGSKNLARLVGNILNKNSKPVIIPCHRVIKSDGKIGGYVFGQKEKEKLLRKENIKIKDGKIIDFEDRFFKFLR